MEMNDKRRPICGIVLVLTALLVVQHAATQGGFGDRTGTAKVRVVGVPRSMTDSVYFLLFGGTDAGFTRLKFEDGLELASRGSFKRAAETVFHFPGWGEDPATQPSVLTLAAAFATQNRTNFVAVDYSRHVRGGGPSEYFVAAYNATLLGRALGQFFRRFAVEVQPAADLRLLSHSLGSHVLSQTAAFFRPDRFRRLTALDPAGPGFTLPGMYHFSSGDGDFVDVIHTDAGVYGDSRTLGHADFFPNSGRRVQPYCERFPGYEFCSHHMSWRYYAESVTSPGSFPARRCVRIPLCSVHLHSCPCARADRFEYMGYGLGDTARGQYYLRTDDKPPYGLGTSGTYF